MWLPWTHCDCEVPPTLTCNFGGWLLAVAMDPHLKGVEARVESILESSMDEHGKVKSVGDVEGCSKHTAPGGGDVGVH